ncbi:MAG: spore cortex biosynthesis protein YabQ [Lachnospiraceae bacterium]|nr:spore cortex biosynthesis protein YabQ [Lachnospiraceae bacterium]
MSQSIIDEVTFLLHSFLMGILITFVYDGFIILRRLIRHNLFLISLEDLIFWIACAIGVFYMLYEENNGILRWFAVFGAALGMAAYKKIVSPFLIKIITMIIERILNVLFCVLHFLFKPVKFAGGKVFKGASSVSKKGKKAGRCMKKKLTERMNLLKITLCKH